jgi:hypothetical protein
LIANGRSEEARSRLDTLTPNISTEYERGCAHALAGILSVLAKQTDTRLISDPERITRASGLIMKEQIIDRFDKGYFDTMLRFARHSKAGTREPEEESKQSSRTTQTNGESSVEAS